MKINPDTNNIFKEHYKDLKLNLKVTVNLRQGFLY